MKTAMRCGGILLLAWATCGHAGRAEADFTFPQGTTLETVLDQNAQNGADYGPLLVLNSFTSHAGSVEAAIQFNLDQFSGITEAVLRLHPVAVPQGGVDLTIYGKGTDERGFPPTISPGFSIEAGWTFGSEAVIDPFPPGSDGTFTLDVSDFIVGQKVARRHYVGFAFLVTTVPGFVSFSGSLDPIPANRPTLLITAESTTVPEPSSLAMCGLAALTALGFVGARRRAA